MLKFLNAERRKIITMSEYTQQANDFAKKYGVTLEIGDQTQGNYWKDGIRNRFECTLTRGKQSYEFEFTMGVGSTDEPTMYDALACMQKFDVGSFEDFCSEFGYNDLPLSAYTETMKTYKAVCKEFEAMERLFSDCMEELQEIG